MCFVQKCNYFEFYWYCYCGYCCNFAAGSEGTERYSVGSLLVVLEMMILSNI